jgi:hypothetical protein
MMKFKTILAVILAVCISMTLIPSVATASASLEDSAIPAPTLQAISASAASIRLTWNVLDGINGYEIFKSAAADGKYARIFTTTSPPTAIYTNTRLITGNTYFYKIRAYKLKGSRKIYGPFSETVSAIPSTDLSDRAYTIFYQGNPEWNFEKSVAKEACLVAAYAVTINNMGIAATPASVFASNGNTLRMDISGLIANFGVRTVCAISESSPYLAGFDGIRTFVRNPVKNAVSAVKEALNMHPEGVILYFRRGTRAHSIVASKYDGNTIYYSDPGRRFTRLLPFETTWVRAHHRMTYKYLVNIVALDNV